MENKSLINQLAKLVAIKTYSDNRQANSEALDLIETWVDKKRSRKRIRNRDSEILLLGNGNLIRPDIGYLVHVDVVDGKKSQFKLTRKKGRLCGRGVSDMKFAIPIGIQLLNRAIKEKIDKDVVVAITTDEEVGGAEGSGYLAEQLSFRPKLLVVPDGGDGFVFINKLKGVVHLLIESKGQAAHASEPWAGKNALEPLCYLATRLANRYRRNNSKPNWKTTINLGCIDGGVSTNQVCAEAKMKIDIRFPESRSDKEILKEVKLLAKKVDLSLRVKLIASGDPCSTDIRQPMVKKFVDLMREMLGREPDIQGDAGTTDARYWARYKIPVIITKPVGGGIHADDEWIDVEAMFKFRDLIWRYIKAL